MSSSERKRVVALALPILVVAYLSVAATMLVQRIEVLIVGTVLTAVSAVYVMALDAKRQQSAGTPERGSELAFMAAHQLREPLTQLSWMTDVLADESASPEERAEALAGMRQIIRQSVKLTGDLLDISRAERGLLVIERENVPVAALVDDALAAIRAAASSKNIRFAVEVPRDAIVRVDRTKAVEAVRNVVDNAIKYGPAGEAIEIAAARASAGSAVSITVRDRGPGIPEDVRPRLFKGATAPAKKGGGEGAGLGLYLTKLFIEAMGGRIGFDTSPAGTTFTITLPAGPRK